MRISQYIGIYCPGEISCWSSAVEYSIVNERFYMGVSDCFDCGEQSVWNLWGLTSMSELFYLTALISYER